VQPDARPELVELSVGSAVLLAMGHPYATQEPGSSADSDSQREIEAAYLAEGLLPPERRQLESSGFVPFPDDIDKAAEGF
jgi:hypothetical protein